MWNEMAPAEFDSERRYRYSLMREVNPDGHGAVLWVMLNPSTADEHVLDPTLRRCFAYTKAWGFGGMLVGNVCAHRSTNPRVLRGVDDPVGPENLKWLERMAAATTTAGVTVVGWGADSLVTEDLRARTLVALYAGERSKYTFAQNARPVYCLGQNLNGSPKHPLYLRGDLEPTIYRP